MKIRSVYAPTDSCEVHRDDRGLIADVFYNASVQHVAMIESVPDAVRGNHFHKSTTQHILVVQGSLQYWFTQVGDAPDTWSGSSATFVDVRVGDLVTTPPYEAHALKIGPAGCVFLALSQGLRGGRDYEQDTFRVPTIIG